MTDRELLARAAVAYFGDAPKHIGVGVLDWVRDCIGEWNPLTDDGDALRLAVKLNLQINPTIKTDYGPASTVYDGGKGIATVQHGGDGSMATREAIVRAAAAIGKAME